MSTFGLKKDGGSVFVYSRRWYEGSPFGERESHSFLEDPIVLRQLVSIIGDLNSGLEAYSTEATNLSTCSLMSRVLQPSTSPSHFWSSPKEL